MTGKIYNVAAIGCGAIWSGGHWGGLKEMTSEARVRYVFDTNADLARKAAAETGAEALDSPDRMFEDPAVDIVTLATPPAARLGYVRRACAAKKHLMIEKPMARTLDDALAIRDAVRSAGVRCFVPFGRAVNELWRRAVNVIASGEIGAPRVFVHTNIGTPYFWVPLDHWMHDMTQSGGPIFDFSIHFVELARACMGAEAAEVFYMGAATTARVKSDDHATLLIRYDGGGLGQFTKSWAVPPNVKTGHNADHVICQEGVVVLGAEVEIHTASGVRKLAASETGAQGRAGAYRNLIAAIEERAELHASEVEGLRTIEILDAALRSRETGRIEKVVCHG